VLISQSSARQRGGRAAREGPGTVWRIYTENDYQGMEPHSRVGASVDDLSPFTGDSGNWELVDTPDFDIVTAEPSRNSRNLVYGRKPA
jgi:ATP-dependent helicase HrpB